MTDLEKLKQTITRCKPSAQFNAKLEAIRTTHKPKRNFMKSLAESGL